MTAMWIETENIRIIFDTGQGIALENNALTLGIDPAEANILVLSHGHYDHTGGIIQVLQQAQKTDVYCNPGIVYPRYTIINGTAKPIQIPSDSMEAIEKLSVEHLHWVQQPTWVPDKIGITGPIPRMINWEDPGGPFYLDPEGKRADPIDDDQALWVRTNDGFIVCVGCSHAGLVNTLNYVRSINHGFRL